MSEKVYAWLLRLYPAHFREKFGDEALQLFRDRARDERGFFPRLRLWVDLLGDLAISVPREHRLAHQRIIAASVQARLDGVPSFQFLEGESPRLSALFFGGLVSLLAIWSFSIPSGHVGTLRVPNAQPAVEESARMTKMAHQTLGRKLSLDAAERKRVIDGVIANLEKYYVYPDVARKMADALLSHEKRGGYDSVTKGRAFADLLTDQLREVSPDYQLSVVFSPQILPDPMVFPPEFMAREPEFMRLSNCTFENVEILPHNIGYLKFNSFPDPALCEATATAAMAKLNDADAIIFDLRHNGGEEDSPKMVALIATYLFDHPTHLNDVYNRSENSTEQFWTLPPIPGNNLADKPAYVLTGPGTYSGAEEFSYDLKMLKRATLVGQTTVGGAYVTSGHRINDHFAISVPFARPINPISKRDWQGTGVEPDVKVKAADALDTAQRLAIGKLASR